MIYSLAGGKKQLVYQQTPIKTELWLKRKQNPGDPDFGCYQVEYTLTLTDALLK